MEMNARYTLCLVSLTCCANRLNVTAIQFSAQYFIILAYHRAAGSVFEMKKTQHSYLQVLEHTCVTAYTCYKCLQQNIWQAIAGSTS